MGYIGTKPSAVPLTSADITDGIIVNADINSSASIALTKLASTGTLTVDNIQFPATQVASANANTLDDYEEGTWTPVVTSTTGTLTSTTSTGSYTKIGKVVTVNFRIAITNAGTGGGGLSVGSFPFAATNSTTLSGAAREDTAAGINITGSALSTTSIAFFNGGSTMIATGNAFSCCITYLT